MATDSRQLFYENLSEWLIEEFPELEAKYSHELEWWKDEMPGPHIVYGDLFFPYLVSKLRLRDGEFLQRAFKFLERLVINTDSRVQEVAAFSVLEPLMCDEDLLELARPYMPPTVLRLLTEMEAQNEK